MNKRNLFITVITAIILELHGGCGGIKDLRKTRVSSLEITTGKPKGSLILLLNSAQDSLLKAIIVLGAVWPKTYFLFLFPSSFSETRIRSFDREIKYCISVSISLSLSLSKTGILLRLPWNLGSDGFLINPFSHSSDKYPDRFGAIFFASLSPMGWQTTQVPFKTSSFPLSSLSAL